MGSKNEKIQKEVKQFTLQSMECLEDSLVIH